MQLTGRSFVSAERVAGTDDEFRAIDPTSGQPLEPAYASVDASVVDHAVRAAEGAFEAWGSSDGAHRARLLRTIADEIEARLPALEERVPLETALPAGRVQGETARTCGQLRMFAALVEEGSWVDARIERAQPDRSPVPKPDLRSMLRPLGPVVVFGASNFPLAFSVAGGDTAAALAAGNPVIVKAHPAHPGTSEIVGEAVRTAVERCQLPAGLFSLLFDAGHEVGAALVRHPGVRAVGFTGSRAGGRALMDLAAAREEPIPVFAEMGSINPVFVLEGAVAESAAEIGAALASSVGLATGQFCTCPGLVVVPANGGSDTLVQSLHEGLGKGSAPMLTAGICDAYARGVAALAGVKGVEIVGGSATVVERGTARPSLLRTDSATFLDHSELAREVFGPATLVVTTESAADRRRLAEALEGQLTATVHASADDAVEAAALVPFLERRAGRVLFGGVPTGVEVSSSMVHGGPYPATSDGRSTSVGTAAILRFTRPVAFQDFPPSLLPAELRDGNPKAIWRLVDGERSRS